MMERRYTTLLRSLVIGVLLFPCLIPSPLAAGVIKIDPIEFRDMVIIPTLMEMDTYISGMYSDEAVRLLLGTVLMESRLSNLRQKGRGPALGVYQIEPKTATDVFLRYSKQRENIEHMILGMFGDDAYTKYKSTQLVTDLRFATVVARLKYWMIPAKLGSSIEDIANYWDVYYNANPHKGFAAEFIKRYKAATEVN